MFNASKGAGPFSFSSISGALRRNKTFFLAAIARTRRVAIGSSVSFGSRRDCRLRLRLGVALPKVSGIPTVQEREHLVVPPNHGNDVK